MSCVLAFLAGCVAMRLATTALDWLDRRRPDDTDDSYGDMPAVPPCFSEATITRFADFHARGDSRG